MLTIISETQNEKSERKVAPSGIGGWLILPAIGLVISPIIIALGVAFNITEINSPLFQSIEHKNPGFRAAVIGESIMSIGVFFFGIYVATLFFEKSRSLPKMMINLLLTGLLISFISAIWTLIVFEARGVEIRIMELMGLVIPIFRTLIGILYFSESKRVAATFVN